MVSIIWPCARSCFLLRDDKGVFRWYCVRDPVFIIIVTVCRVHDNTPFGPNFAERNLEYDSDAMPSTLDVVRGDGRQIKIDLE